MNEEARPCDCGWLTYLLNESDSPVKLNEKHGFTLEDQSGACSPIYFCPGCGGKLPDASRPIWYPKLDAVEKARIEKLIQGIKTLEEARERLGEPDYIGDMIRYDLKEEFQTGEPVIATDFNDGRFILNEEHSFKTKNVEYYNLSEHANIEFYFGPDSRVRIVIMVKCLPPRHIVPSSPESD